MRDFIFEFLLPVVIILGAVVGTFAIGIDRHQHYACNKLAEVSGKRTQYVSFDVCYVEHNGEMLRYDIYKATMTASDALEGVK